MASDGARPPAGCGTHTLFAAGLSCSHLSPTTSDTADVTTPLQSCPQLCPSLLLPPLPPLAHIQSVSCSIAGTCCVRLDIGRPPAGTACLPLNPSVPSSLLCPPNQPQIRDGANCPRCSQLSIPHDKQVPSPPGVSMSQPLWPLH